MYISIILFIELFTFLFFSSQSSTLPFPPNFYQLVGLSSTGLILSYPHPYSTSTQPRSAFVALVCSWKSDQQQTFPTAFTFSFAPLPHTLDTNRFLNSKFLCLFMSFYLYFSIYSVSIPFAAIFLRSCTIKGHLSSFIFINWCFPL